MWKGGIGSESGSSRWRSPLLKPRERGCWVVVTCVQGVLCRFELEERANLNDSNSNMHKSCGVREKNQVRPAGPSKPALS